MFDVQYVEHVKHYFNCTTEKNRLENNLDDLEASIAHTDQNDPSINTMLDDHGKLLELWEQAFQRWEDSVDRVSKAEVDWANSVLDQTS